MYPPHKSLFSFLNRVLLFSVVALSVAQAGLFADTVKKNYVGLSDNNFFALQDWAYKYKDESDVSIDELQRLLKNGIPQSEVDLVNTFNKAALAHNEPVLALLTLTGSIKTVPVSKTQELPILHFLAMYNFAAALEFILTSDQSANSKTQRQFNVNAVSVDGWTPLHIAAYYKNPSAASVLISHGVDLLATTETTKETPLHLAIRARQKAIVKLFIEKCDSKCYRAQNYLLETAFQLAALENGDIYKLLSKKMNKSDQKTMNAFGWNLTGQSTMRKAGLLKTVTNFFQKNKNKFWAWWGGSSNDEHKEDEEIDDVLVSDDDVVDDNTSNENMDENMNTSVLVDDSQRTDQDL